MSPQRKIVFSLLTAGGVSFHMIQQHVPHDGNWLLTLWHRPCWRSFQLGKERSSINTKLGRGPDITLSSFHSPVFLCSFFLFQPMSFFSSVVFPSRLLCFCIYSIFPFLSSIVPLPFSSFSPFLLFSSSSHLLSPLLFTSLTSYLLRFLSFCLSSLLPSSILLPPFLHILVSSGSEKLLLEYSLFSLHQQASDIWLNETINTQKAFSLYVCVCNGVS